MQKEAKARIKINELLQNAGWRFFDDEKGNKVLIEFPNIKRDYVEDSYFIEESAHGVIDNKDLKIFEKFIDSKELYVIFEKSNKYPIKLPYPVRNAILDVIRKYKLMQES